MAERISKLATVSRHAKVCGVGAESLRAKSRDASLNERRREIHILHRGDSDPLQRMLNAIQPGSYIRPHRHHAPPKAESLVLLAGSVGFVPFREDGTPDLEGSILLERSQGALALDCREGVWHTFFALEPDTVVFEVKAGPYDPTADKEYAPWAPEEGSSEACDYLASLERAFRERFLPS